MTNVLPKTPLVSVLTTSYNREAYIAETIESVLAQTMTDFEYIIVDDCSQDQTFEIAQSYARKDSRVRVYRNETNLGDYPNRNKAASYASGKYLKYIDSDDILYPHALEVCSRYMEMFPEAGLGLSKLHGQERPLPRICSPVDAYSEHFFGAGLFSNAPGSVIIRRETFESVGRFSGKRMIGDFEMWLILARSSHTVLFPGLINWDRRHADQESNFDQLSYAALHRDVAMAAVTAPECPLSAADRQRAKHQIRYQAACVGMYQCLRRLSPLKAARFLLDSHCSFADVLRAAGAASPGLRRIPLFRN
jgi:GT2 family glycosyltransferase